MRLTASLRGPIATAIVLTVVALLLAGCSGGDREAAAIPEAQLLPSGPPPTIEAQIRARPWVSSKANGQAFGELWRKGIRNPKDRDGRGIDAYNWAGRTCDAVRLGNQSPEAMVRRVRVQGRFTAQGARVIVSAALQALCPERDLLNKPSP